MVNKNGKKLNRLELQLQRAVEDIMLENDVKFSVFLPVLRNDLPEDRSSNEYKNKHKAEYLKQLRASYSVEEIKKMLDVLDYKLILMLDNKEIKPVKYSLDDLDDIKVKYTDLMAMCELLGIKINWIKKQVIEGKNKKFL